MNRLHFSAGDTIFAPGDLAARAFQIQSGRVDLLRHTAGETIQVAQLGPGDVFGEMSLIEERPHSLTARAMSDVELSTLTRQEFEQFLTSDPARLQVYLRALFERLRGLSAQLDSAAGSPAPADASTVFPIVRRVEADVQTIHAQRPHELVVTIYPLTRRAAATLPLDGLPVTKYPFRIGRAAEEHEPRPLDLNDLWLVDRMPFNISRNHASLEQTPAGIAIHDRGSSLGIFVNEAHIGGGSPHRYAMLEEGENTVILGMPMSPYQFRIHIARN